MAAPQSLPSFCPGSGEIVLSKGSVKWREILIRKSRESYRRTFARFCEQCSRFWASSINQGMSLPPLLSAFPL